MRCALAKILLDVRDGDIILLDEVTNHRKYRMTRPKRFLLIIISNSFLRTGMLCNLLHWHCDYYLLVVVLVHGYGYGFWISVDLQVVEWVESHLCSLHNNIIICVSHDREFIDNVATDIIELKNKKLVYFPGNYSDWLLHCEEVSRCRESRLDAQSRQEEHIKRSIAHAKAHGNDSGAKAKVKKLERVSMQRRLDGKKFHLFSLKKMVW
jgi:ATPase subunit of ABC transporter with duplicated ATPase domains